MTLAAVDRLVRHATILRDECRELQKTVRASGKTPKRTTGFLRDAESQIRVDWHRFCIGLHVMLHRDLSFSGGTEMKTERLNQQYRIRRARAEEASVLIALALRSKASNGYDEAFLQAHEAIYNRTYTPQKISEGETWVAEGADGRLYGFFGLRRSDDGVEVWAMFVEPGLKRSGVGRALWRKLENCAQSMGAERINLAADPFAVPFYSAMGMEVIGTEPVGAIPGLFLPRLTKSLAISR